MQDNDEEELRVGAERVPKRVQRPLMVVLVAVLGLGGAFVLERINQDDTTAAGSSASPAVSAGPSGTGTSGSTTSVVPLPSVSSVVSCPAGANCRTVVDELPAAVVAGLREYYPGAVVRSSSTLTRTNSAGTVLLKRSIKAAAGARRFDIVVTPFVLGPDDFDRQNSVSTSTVTVKSTGAGQTVQLTLTEPRTARPNDLTVLRLARDPRLTALR